MAKDAALKDLKAKKRKASTPEHDVEKPKKVKNAVADASAAPAKKRKATEDAAPAKAKKPKTPADSTATDALASTKNPKTKKPKSVVNGNTDTKSAQKVEASDKPVEKKDAKAVKTSTKPVKDTSNGTSAPTSSKKSSLKKPKSVEEKVEAVVEDADDEEVDEDSEDELDDQTEALLKGFESDSDEQDAKVKETYEEGDAIPSITENKELSKKKQAKLKKVAEFPGQGKPGVVYVGRIPHGFFENEMKAYFGQFGKILKLRLSRNKRTGASKHFAFIEFEDSSVADIVAKTMDNYLMFGHILKVKFIPEERVPADVWKGANKRFKKVPWNKIKGRELEQGASEEQWEQRIELEQERRTKKAEKLKAIGYEFDAPEIKSARGVSKNRKPVPDLTEEEADTEAVEAAPAEEEDTKAIDAAPTIEESNKPKKNKKKSKAAKEDASVAAAEEPSKVKKEEIPVAAKPSKEELEESVAALIAEATEKPAKKTKKDKKKSSEAVVPEEDLVNIEPAVESIKPKKSKKSKKANAVAE